MLAQLHYQFRDGHTEMVAQRELLTQEGDVQKFINEIKDRHPLPDGAIWMICNEDSPHFVRQALEA